jgi:hypothetical protein
MFSVLNVSQEMSPLEGLTRQFRNYFLLTTTASVRKCQIIALILSDDA